MKGEERFRTQGGEPNTKIEDRKDGAGIKKEQKKPKSKVQKSQRKTSRRRGPPKINGRKLKRRNERADERGSSRKPKKLKKIHITEQRKRSASPVRQKDEEQEKEMPDATKHEPENHDKEQQQPSEEPSTDEGEDDISMSSTEKQANAELIERYKKKREEERERRSELGEKTQDEVIDMRDLAREEATSEGQTKDNGTAERREDNRQKNLEEE